MGLQGSKSSEGIDGNKPKETIQTVKLKREEQVEWFSFVVEKNEIEVAQHIKENHCIVTALMHFDSTNECTCSLDVEQSLSSESCSRDEVIKNLRSNISRGVCPHVRVRSGDVDFPNSTDDTRHQSSSFTQKVKPCGIYWIHLAIITGKRNLIKILLPYLSNFEVQKFVFYTCSHKFSPLHLALLHNNIELISQFLQFDKQFANDVLNSHTSVTAAICKNVKAMRTIWPYLDHNCDRTRERLENLLKMCLVYGSSSCASFLRSKGLSLASRVLRIQLLAAISAKDIERVKICLSGVNACKVCVDGLIQATEIGNNEIVSLILEKMKSIGEEAFDNIQLPLCMVNSVFSHNIQVITTLITYGIDVNTAYCGVSLLSWTNTLGLKNIKTILTKAGGTSYNTYIELYKCLLTDIVNLKVNTLNNVKLLVEKGYDPNGRHRSTTSAPVYAALNGKKYEILEYLLLQGADLYLKRGTLYEFYVKFDPRLHYDDWMTFLTVLVKTNVMFDSCANDSHMWSLVADQKCERLLEIILKTSHRLARSDIALLRKWETRDLPSNSSKMITWWLHDVKSLQVSCRNSLRRHYGCKFYNFTQKIESSIPKKILKYIRCEDITQKYNTN